MVASRLNKENYLTFQEEWDRAYNWIKEEVTYRLEARALDRLIGDVEEGIVEPLRNEELVSDYDISDGEAPINPLFHFLAFVQEEIEDQEYEDARAARQKRYRKWLAKQDPVKLKRKRRRAYLKIKRMLNY